VLNIVDSVYRLLSSQERCLFRVHNDDNTNDTTLVDTSSNGDSDDNNGSGSSDVTNSLGGDNAREGIESNSIYKDVILL